MYQVVFCGKVIVKVTTEELLRTEHNIYKRCDIMFRNYLCDNEVRSINY